MGRNGQLELPPFDAQEARDRGLGKAVALHGGRHARHDGKGRHVLGDDRAGRDDRAVADVHARHHVDVVAGPDIVSHRHVREHVRRALEAIEFVVLLDPVE
jgi:hypothetical protein